jgi:hypothetical protein
LATPVRDFLARRHKVAGRGTHRFSCEVAYEPDVPISGIRLSDWFHREAIPNHHHHHGNGGEPL